MKQTVDGQNTLGNKVITWMVNNHPNFLTLVIDITGELNPQLAIGR